MWRVQFGAADVIPRVDLDIEVLDKDQEPSDSQVRLTRQLAVTMPDDQVWWITRHEASLTRDRDGSSLFHGSGSHTGKFFLDQVARVYPTGTRILRGSLHRRHEHHERFVGEETGDDPSTFTGSFHGVVLKRNQLASLPVKEGAGARLPGVGRLRLTSIRDAGPSFELKFSSVRLATLSHEDRSRLGLHSTDSFLFVLSHPEGRTVIFPDNDSNRTSQNGPAGLALATHEVDVTKDSIRVALGGNATRADLSKLQVDIFDLAPVGAATGSFHKKNWIPYVAPKRLENGEIEPPPAWVEARLPANPTKDQVEHYLDELIFGLPADIRGQQHQEIQQRFNALGDNHLDHLIARLPVAHYAREFTFRTIRKFATEDHLAALLAALPDEPRVGAILRGLGRGREAVPALKERLGRHTPFDHGVTWQVVRIVAADQDPATYDDLRWHFIHADTGHGAMIKSLSVCAGFPLDESIEAAWIRTRSGLVSQGAGLCFHALRTGDPEALRQSLNALMRSPDAQKRAAVEAAVDQPAGADLVPWLHSHFQELEFDPERRLFFLPD